MQQSFPNFTVSNVISYKYILSSEIKTTLTSSSQINSIKYKTAPNTIEILIF